MDKIKFGIIGSGWRSLFYVRVAKALPRYFSLTGVLVRNEEKKRMMEDQYGVQAFESRDDFLKERPDFVVVAVNKASIFSVAKEYVQLGIPVLTETPPGLTTEDLEQVWRLRKQGARIQVAEQYFLYPSIKAKLAAVSAGLLGEVHSVDLSCAHDYHAASLIRLFLGTGQMECALRGQEFYFPVLDTDSRAGITYEGEVGSQCRRLVTLEFSNGKVGFYDFSGVSYHSYIRSRHLRVYGPLGEIDDQWLRAVDERHNPYSAPFYEIRDSNEGGILGISLGEKCLYQTPFGGTRLTEDEIAVATFLLGMREYLETGKEVYPLSSALQDAYLSILMQQAAAGAGQVVRTRPMIWNQEEN